MSRPVGRALSTMEAAHYIGWPVRSLRQRWRSYPILAAGAVKCGRRLTFLQSALDAHNRVHRVGAAMEVARA